MIIFLYFNIMNSHRLKQSFTIKIVLSKLKVSHYQIIQEFRTRFNFYKILAQNIKSIIF
jgi:hypothetical protein